MIREHRLILHIFKILLGIFAGYFIAKISDRLEITWMLISTFLILSPEGGDALELAITRIKANLIGACSGFILVAMELQLVISITLGALTSLIVCEIIGLNTGARAALAAMIIVLMNQAQGHPWESAFHRVISVFLGCIIGLIITYLVHSVLKWNLPVDEKDQSKVNPTAKN